MSWELPKPPPWIADLPSDRRGFPAPAEAGWDTGVPILSKVATDRKVVLGVQRACAVCGYELPKGSPVYRAFAQGDAAHMRMYERERSHDPSGPLHLSCVLYSAMACPYLRERNSRLGASNEINPGARRGTRAAIMGFSDFGLMIYAEPHRFLDPEAPIPMFAYLNLVEDIGYRDGGELQQRFEAAVAADSAVIDMSKPRRYWTDDANDQKVLVKDLQDAFHRIQRSQPSYEQRVLDSGRYVIYQL